MIANYVEDLYLFKAFTFLLSLKKKGRASQEYGNS